MPNIPISAVYKRAEEHKPMLEVGIPVKKKKARKRAYKKPVKKSTIKQDRTIMNLIQQCITALCLNETHPTVTTEIRKTPSDKRYISIFCSECKHVDMCMTLANNRASECKRVIIPVEAIELTDALPITEVDFYIRCLLSALKKQACMSPDDNCYKEQMYMPCHRRHGDKHHLLSSGLCLHCKAYGIRVGSLFEARDIQK